MPDEQADGLLYALESLAKAIEANADDEELLLERLSQLGQRWRSGSRVTQALAEETAPGALQLLGRVLSRLTDASGTARRALAETMRAEGTSIPAIARTFGVTHQRVSNILSRHHGGGRPSPTEHDGEEEQRYG